MPSGLGNKPRSEKKRSEQYRLPQADSNIRSYIAIENAVGFQIQGNEKENHHGGRGPAEHLNGERSDKPRAAEAWPGRSFAKNQSAHQTNRSGQSQQSERVVDLLIQFTGWIQECGVEHGIQRKDAGHEGDRLGEF